MKKTSLSLVFLVIALGAVPQPAAAQLGIRGGISLNDFFGQGVDQTEQTQKLSYGISVGLIRMGAFQITAEGYYRQKGAGLGALDALNTGGGPVALDSAQIAGLVGGSIGNQTLEFGLDYVEIPLLLRWNITTLGGRFRPYVNAGPAFGWRIDCGVSVSLEGASEGSGPESACQDLSQENLEETLRNYETGLVVGGGLDMAVLGGAGALTLDARLTRGLSRLSAGQDGVEVKNQAFSAVLGYTFGFF